MTYPSIAWEDWIYEDYCIYLEMLDPDVSYMTFEEFKLMKFEEAEENFASSLMD
jgi:hypothetical protein